MKDGKKKYDVKFYEKDSETGNWYSKYVSTYDMPSGSDMKKRIKEWESKKDDNK